MLRTLIALLIAANVGVYAWTQSWLAPLGLAPVSPREPQRLEQQIQPEALRILSPLEARRLEQQASLKIAECWVSPVLSAGQLGPVRSALEGWPGGSWQLSDSQIAARWIVYMGKYPNAEALARKKTELRQIGLNYETLRNASLEPGVSLGHFATKAQADRALQEFTQKGVRTGRVVEEQPAQTGQVLRLPAVDEGLKPRLDAVRSALGEAQLARCTG
jgi:hypothetical protein